MSTEGVNSQNQFMEIVVQEFEVDPATGMSTVVYTEDESAALMLQGHELVPIHQNAEGTITAEHGQLNKHIVRRLVPVLRKGKGQITLSDSNNQSVAVEGSTSAGPWVVQLHPAKNETAEPKKRKARRLTSDVWNHFERVDAERAKCERCGKLLAHSGNTTNLKKHMEVCQGEKVKESQDLVPFVPKFQQVKLQMSGDKAQRKRRYPSDVWNHFDKVDKQHAKCFHCEKLVSHSGNTSNLRKHLEITHQQKRPDIPGSMESSLALLKSNISDSPLKRMSGENETLRTKRFLFYLQKFFVDNCLPFDMVENKSFLDLVRYFDKRVQVPSKTLLMSRIDEMYSILKAAYVSELKQKSSFSLTCETWTDALNAASFLSVSVHFVNIHFLDSITIGTRQISDQYTSKDLDEIIQDILEDWQIPIEKVSACVTNGSANIFEATCSVFTLDCHLHCFACNLNTVVSDAIRKCPDLNVSLDKVMSVVMSFKRNDKASEQLKKEQEAQNEAPLKLIQGCPSRWFSLCEMLERYLKLEMFLAKAILQDLNLDVELPTKHERDMLQECTKLLCPFFEAVKEISSEKYVSASKILPICKILNLATKSVTVTFQQTILLKENLLQSMKTHLQPFEDIKILNMCTILDPRFKTRPISNHLAKTEALLAINDEIQENQSSVKKVDDARNGSTTESANVSKNIWDFYNELPYKSKISSKESSYDDELTQYLDVPPIERQANPLQFWNDHKQSYASLYLTARKYSSIVGNSVPSECLFSKSGSTTAEKRNHLPLKHAEKLLFLSSLSENRWNAINI